MSSPKKRAAILQPLTQLQMPADFLGVIFDWDTCIADNKTNMARIIPYLQDMQRAGFLLIAISAQSVKAIENLIIQSEYDWSLHAIIAENGALAWVKTPNGGFDKHYFLNNPQAHLIIRHRLNIMLHHIEATVPGLKRARNWQAYECGLILDHGDLCDVPRSRVLQCLTILEVAGFQALVTQKYIHAWYGKHGPLKSVAWVLRDFFKLDVDKTALRWMYIGGGAHYWRFFEKLPLSVGLMQIRHDLQHIPHAPAFLAPDESVAGFVAVIQKILANENNYLKI